MPLLDAELQAAFRAPVMAPPEGCQRPPFVRVLASREEYRALMELLDEPDRLRLIPLEAAPPRRCGAHA
eukprot:11196301-Lingulodinium_polyedra.AAC.1